MNKKKSSTEFPSHFELNGTNIANKQIIADEFNNLFVNVGPNLANNIPAVNTAASIFDYTRGGPCQHGLIIAMCGSRV